MVIKGMSQAASPVSMANKHALGSQRLGNDKGSRQLLSESDG